MTAGKEGLRYADFRSDTGPILLVSDQGGGKFTYPLNYGCNFGTWFVFDPATGLGGDGAFCINKNVKAVEITDGLSNTVGFSEVKAYQHYVRNSSAPTALNAPSAARRAADTASPGSATGTAAAKW